MDTKDIRKFKENEIKNCAFSIERNNDQTKEAAKIFDKIVKDFDKDTNQIHNKTTPVSEKNMSITSTNESSTSSINRHNDNKEIERKVLVALANFILNENQMMSTSSTSESTDFYKNNDKSYKENDQNISTTLPNLTRNPDENLSNSFNEWSPISGDPQNSKESLKDHQINNIENSTNYSKNDFKAYLQQMDADTYKHKKRWLNEGYNQKQQINCIKTKPDKIYNDNTYQFCNIQVFHDEMPKYYNNNNNNNNDDNDDDDDSDDSENYSSNDDSESPIYEPPNSRRIQILCGG